MLVNHNIDNLSGGVSTQPYEARYDNQVEDMVNFIPTISNGLRKRNGMGNKVNTTDFYESDCTIHSYDRGDGQEKYGIMHDSTGLRVFNENGEEITVNKKGILKDSYNSTGGTYDLNKALKFLTVGDTTWILDTEMIVESSTHITSLRPSDFAFYWVKKSFDDGKGEGYDYQIVLDNHIYSVNSTSTIKAAIALKNKLNNGTIIGFIRTDALRWDVGSFYAATSKKIDWVINKIPSSEGGCILYGSVDNTDWVQIDSHGGENVPSATKTVTSSYRYYKIVESEAAGGLIQVRTSVSDYDVKQEGSILRIAKNDNSSFTFESGDSWGNQASVGWEDSISKISDLPADMSGFTNTEVGTIAVTGTDRDNFNSYYLGWNGAEEKWYEKSSEAELIDASGDIWGYIDKGFNSLTMPKKLVRNSDGTFTLDYISDWSDRDKGDIESNPLPSFVGNKISNLFFFKNRLCFTSGENVILSAIGDYYNFFATTVMEILDSDPIDASIDSDSVSIIRNVTVASGSVTLWADNAQFLLSGGEILSPLTTRISQTSSYKSSPDLEPITLDNEVMFFNRTENQLQAFSYSPAGTNIDRSTAEELSSHIPNYIPETISSVKVSRSYNTVFLCSEGSGNEIYCYKYHIHNSSKVMSSWFKLKFPTVTTIDKIEVLGDRLYLLCDTSKLNFFDAYDSKLDIILQDYPNTTFEANVTLSRFALKTNQGTKNIRDTFYFKNMKISKEGYADIVIVDEERNSEKIVYSDTIDRGFFIGGNNKKTKIKIVSGTNRDLGCKIDAISVEGMVKTKSRNV